MRPCPAPDCGELASGTYCDDHAPAKWQHAVASAAARGYDSAHRRLSIRARKMQPFCLYCGSTSDLQLDHTEEAWARHYAGKPARLKDYQVLCGPCNQSKGTTR